MELRKGDRFRFKEDGDIWEYTGNTENRYNHEGVCIEVGNCRSSYVGEVDTWDFKDTFFWDYLGNFGKSTNFNTLYDKLNNECN